MKRIEELVDERKEKMREKANESVEPGPEIIKLFSCSLSCSTQLCTKRRFKSACTSPHFHQSLHCPHEGTASLAIQNVLGQI